MSFPSESCSCDLNRKSDALFNSYRALNLIIIQVKKFIDYLLQFFFCFELVATSISLNALSKQMVTIISAYTASKSEFWSYRVKLEFVPKKGLRDARMRAVPKD
jgi:hypothetical protein